MTGIDWDVSAPWLLLLVLVLGAHVTRHLHKQGRATPTRARPTRPPTVRRARAGLAWRFGRALFGVGALGMLLLAGAAWWMHRQAENAGIPLAGVVTHVRDGDTIEVARRPIRLSGLNCDERGTVLGDRATAAMRGLVQGREVRCMLNGERTHDREVGRCSLPNGEDLGAMMIASRLCGRCARHDPGRFYVAVQAEAGPYAGPTPGYCLAPW